MSGTKYASAVAAVKAMENTLLTHTDIDQLINASGKNEIKNLIASKKGTDSENASLQEVWNMLHDYAPDCEELKIILYKNDFHNLKAALKSMIADIEPDRCYIKPTNLDTGSLKKILSSKEYDSLPAYIRDTAEKAYELLTRTLDGQLADMLIDRAALEKMISAADKCDNDFIKKYAELTAVCADIKTAYRCCLMKKQYPFIESGLCGTKELDRETLAKASAGGMESLMTLLESSSYAEGAKLLEKSTAKFEKWCDDIISELAESVHMNAFGSEPLLAYYIATETEIKNLRILSICKEFGADRDTITERMRKLYV